jgi:hypothetical protein
MIFILAAFLVIGTNACTSKKASDETADMDAAGDESLDSVDAAANDDLSTDSKGGGGEALNDLGGANDDLAPEEKLDDKSAQAAPPAGGDAGAQNPNDLTEPPPAEAGNQPGEVPPPAPDITPPPGETAPPVAESAPPPAEPMAPPTPEPAAGEAAAPKPGGTLLKIKSQPEKVGKTILNAVYIARKGDNPESISQKVLGSKDKIKALCKFNSFNCNRKTKVGDKFYYNSPQRPNDETVMKTFYEDAGIAPQMYTAKAGDNIRKVGKELLGDDRSWMEIWATNDVESKQGLDEGTKLKYWPDTESAAPTQTVAKTEEAAPPPAEAANPPGDQANGAPPPPPDAGAAAGQTPPPGGEQAANAPPPPPPPGGDQLPPPPDQAQNPNAAAAGQTAAPPEPPPPPPPPAADQANHKEPAAVDANAALQDPNQTMMLGVGAVLLLAAAALFISIRKKRARRAIDFNTTTQTQIE